MNKDKLFAIDDYDLPDAELLKPNGERGRMLVWIPEREFVVIGKGSKVELEVHEGAVVQDDIAIVRRATGGCAVVITPAMLIVSFALYNRKQIQSKDFFQLFNHAIISAFERQEIARLYHAGISDIAFDGRKIAGTALYRNRETVFYHAVINAAGTTDPMEKYLKYPPRTPDYRKDRKHAEFVTSLAEAGFAVDVPRFEVDLGIEFRRIVELLTEVAC